MADVTFTLLQFFNFRLINIKAQSAKPCRDKCMNQRQANIPQSNDPHFGLTGFNGSLQRRLSKIRHVWPMVRRRRLSDSGGEHHHQPIAKYVSLSNWFKWFSYWSEQDSSESNTVSVKRSFYYLVRVIYRVSLAVSYTHLTLPTKA